MSALWPHMAPNATFFGMPPSSTPPLESASCGDGTRRQHRKGVTE